MIEKVRLEEAKRNVKTRDDITWEKALSWTLSLILHKLLNGYSFSASLFEAESIE